MSYRDASDDNCTADMMRLAQNYSLKEMAAAAATLLAQCCAKRERTVQSALDLFETYVSEARHELEINFTHGLRRELQ